VVFIKRWIHGAIPALLIHCSIGTVYCWSTFKDTIAQQIGMSPFAVGWAFSLAIFFLGMSAAFAGRLVEKDVHKSSLISAICFIGGLVGTFLTLQFTNGWIALIGIYLFYGVLMGIGLGIGYLSPVKTLMLWFKDNKGLATGISIMGFGLAKMIATPLMVFLQQTFGVGLMFLFLACIYSVSMFSGWLLLKKPEGWKEEVNQPRIKLRSLIKNKQLVGIWLMFYINIHCGLMLISYETQLLSTFFFGAAALTTLLAVIPSITAGFNAAGRIGYATLSDKLKQRNFVYWIIFISCIVTIMAYGLSVCLKIDTTVLGIMVIIVLFVINAGYGGGFSTLPALLSERYSMKQISQIHGIVLSAWAIAGITGNNTSAIILQLTNNNYDRVISVALILYSIALLISILMVGDKKEKVYEFT
jgi:OFA family oxalate/formate antiporter-like MFS transporter